MIFAKHMVITVWYTVAFGSRGTCGMSAWCDSVLPCATVSAICAAVSSKPIMLSTSCITVTTELSCSWDIIVDDNIDCIISSTSLHGQYLWSYKYLQCREITLDNSRWLWADKIAKQRIMQYDRCLWRWIIWNQSSNSRSRARGGPVSDQEFYKHFQALIHHALHLHYSLLANIVC